jgi:hypothetical protein
VLALRAGLAVAAVVGALGVLIATVTAVIRITIGTTTRVAPAASAQTGWDRHGPALLLLALLGLWLLAAALRGALLLFAGGGLLALGAAVAAPAGARERST